MFSHGGSLAFGQLSSFLIGLFVHKLVSSFNRNRDRLDKIKE